MGLIDALRRLLGFSTLNKIEEAIDGLSDEERYELLDYIEGQLSDVETADPEPGGWIRVQGGGWY